MHVLHKFQPHPHQRKVLASRARWTVVLAGVRGGKTYTCAAAFLERIFLDVAQGKVNDVSATGSRHRRPRYHAWVCAPSYALLKEPRRYILDICPRELIEDFYESTGELWLRGGILIEFKSTDDPKHLVSVGLQALWCDEADRIAADAWRGQLMTRLSDRQGWALFSSTPYAARAGFLWQDFISKREEPGSDIVFVTWKFIDNPINKLDELRIAKQRLPPRYFEREYEASLDAFVGMVFQLKDDTHIIDVVPAQRGAFKQVIAGVDWGWNDPGAIVVVGDTGKQLVVLDEIKESHLQVLAPAGERSWITEAARLKHKWNINTFMCDHEPAYVHAFLRANLGALNATKEITVGIRRIDEQMMMNPETKRAGLVIHRECKGLIEEMRNLQWALDKKSGDNKEEPQPGNDHLTDALRYAVMELRRYPDTGIQARSSSPKRQQ